MDEDVDWTLLGKYLFGECTEKETTLVREWIEQDPKRRVVLGQLRKILRRTEDSPHAEGLDAQALWNRIDRETRDEAEDGASSEGNSGPKRSRSTRQTSRSRSRESSLRKVVWAGATASVVALTVALWLFGPLKSGLGNSSSPGPETFVTQKGQRTSVRLTDGTQVRLNVDSRLTVPESFGKEKRVVRLKGEAFFKVREDSTRPFIVRSEGAVTRVLGTAFDVGAYPDDGKVKVAVAKGRVSLQSETSPNEKGGARREEQQDVPGMVSKSSAGKKT